MFGFPHPVHQGPFVVVIVGALERRSAPRVPKIWRVVLGSVGAPNPSMPPSRAPVVADYVELVHASLRVGTGVVEGLEGPVEIFFVVDRLEERDVLEYKLVRRSSG